jgi:two-component sensor histidine kinase
MASSIQARDLKLNQALRQEAALAREIHHRVKNNLQIVSSLINLYARKITDPVARLAFRQIVARVDALSLVHRLIEKKGAVPVIAMKPLILELADQIRVLAEADIRPYMLELDIDDYDLPVDVMTPVALFVVEVLLSGLFGSGPPVQLVRLSLRVEEHEHLLLSVENPALVDAVLQGDTPSSARILNALCEQMKGRMWLDAGATHRLMLRIALRTQPEQSHALSDDILGWGEDALPASVYDGQRISKWDHPAHH